MRHLLGRRLLVLAAAPGLFCAACDHAKDPAPNAPEQALRHEQSATRLLMNPDDSTRPARQSAEASECAEGEQTLRDACTLEYGSEIQTTWQCSFAGDPANPNREYRYADPTESFFPSESNSKSELPSAAANQLPLEDMEGRGPCGARTQLYQNLCKRTGKKIDVKIFENDTICTEKI